ncbi:MAG TPA: hypothetical protein VMW65_01935 [Chloroflexota bacterium]|nr:hypothetical protein [Chloroflexota bacterium]
MAALALQSLLPATAGAASGSGPVSAISLASVGHGTLAPNQTAWYTFAGDGSSAAGVTLDFQPITSVASGQVFFNVDWTQSVGDQGVDWPGYYRIGQGTQSGLPAGTSYWFTAQTVNAPYWVEVVNNSNEPIGYAIGETGKSYPPPWLNPPAPGAVSAPAASTAPAPTAATSGTTSTPTATPTPAPVTSTATDRSGLILNPTVSVSGPFSTVDVRVDSSSLGAATVYRLVVIPPPDAVVDGVTPSQTRLEQGVTWYLGQSVDQADPLTNYSVRFFGSANGTVVEADWATSNDKGVLSVTIKNAPNPAPPGQS